MQNILYTTTQNKKLKQSALRLLCLKIVNTFEKSINIIYLYYFFIYFYFFSVYVFNK